MSMYNREQSFAPTYHYSTGYGGINNDIQHTQSADYLHFPKINNTSARAFKHCQSSLFQPVVKRPPYNCVFNNTDDTTASGDFGPQKPNDIMRQAEVPPRRKRRMGNNYQEGFEDVTPVMKQIRGCKNAEVIVDSSKQLKKHANKRMGKRRFCAGMSTGQQQAM